MDTEDIKREAIIFTKEPLSTFSKKVNEAAQGICLRKPSVLKNRGKLLILAKEKVHESGYIYRKGKSRSKSYGTGCEDASRPKRIKRKRLELAEQSKNYKLCDQLSKEVNKSKRLLGFVGIEREQVAKVLQE